MRDPNSPDPPQPNHDSPHLRARIPSHIGDGVFSTGAIVVTGPSEFVLDFVQNVTRPHRVVARVILPHPVLPQFIDALRKNLEIYSNRFGAPPPQPKPPANEVARPTPQEIYDDLKMSDDVLSGAYANGVMIGHGASEFGLDFITSFFPQSAISARVYLAAGQVPRLLESLIGALKQLQMRGQGHSNPSGLANEHPPGPELFGQHGHPSDNPHPGLPPHQAPPPDGPPFQGPSAQNKPPQNKIPPPGDDPDSRRSPGDDLLPPGQ